MNVRLIVLGMVSVMLASCASSVKLAGAFKESQSYYIAKVKVKPSSSIQIDWAEARDAYFAKHNKLAGKVMPASFNSDGDVVSNGAATKNYNALTQSAAAKAYYKQQAVSRLQSHLKQHTSAILQGKQPATLEVVLQTVDMSSGAGRVLGGTTSTIVGDVRLIDTKTGAVIAANPSVTGMNKGTRMSGNIGLAISLVSNLTSAAQGNYFAKTALDFTTKTKNWLLRK